MRVHFRAVVMVSPTWDHVLEYRDFVQCRYEVRERALKIDIFQGVFSLSITTKIGFYYINTSEIPSELSRETLISSHVKRSPSLWLHNKSRLWKQADLVFHWCLYNKQNITYSFSTLYLTSEMCSLVRYRVDHSKIKFISTCGHVITSIYYFQTSCSMLDQQCCNANFKSPILGSSLQ